MQKYAAFRKIGKPLSLSRFIGWFFIGIILLANISCSTRQLMVKEMTVLMQDGVTAFEKDSDIGLLEKAMPAHIKLAEAMLVQSPSNEDLQVLLAQLFASYAFAFEETYYETRHYQNSVIASELEEISLENEIKDNLNAHYLKGSQYALQALSQKYGEVEAALKNYTRRDQFLSQLTPSDVPALFWYGFNLVGYLSHNLDSVKAMSKVSQIEPVMQRVIALSPDYYYGTAHMVLMVFHAARPAMMGGNLDAALEHYQILKSIAGTDFLLADVLYARYCLPRQQDRKAFEEIMQRVAHASAGSSDPAALFNQVAAKRARIYLKAVDQMFDE